MQVLLEMLSAYICGFSHVTQKNQVKQSGALVFIVCKISAGAFERKLRSHLSRFNSRKNAVDEMRWSSVVLQLKLFPFTTQPIRAGRPALNLCVAVSRGIIFLSLLFHFCYIIIPVSCITAQNVLVLSFS